MAGMMSGRSKLHALAIPVLAIPALLAAALLAATLSCGSGKPGPPSILLISVDTLRPEHLGYGGATRPTSPAIDRLAREGVVFSRARSQAGWTLPSMATILTGRYPRDHRAVDFNFGLDRGMPTLATLLAARGYDTRAYVSHVLLTAQYGLDRGFVRFDASVLDRGNPHKISTSRELAELAEKDMATLRPPYFAWVHFFDPHFAYLAHEEWTSFGDRDIDRYDQEIAYTDRYIGELLAFMETKGLLENTVIVFTADHGEEFGEHGGEYHETCYDEVLRVPLVIRAPGVAAATDTSWVEQVDILPTILARAGVAPPPECAGRDLLAPGSRPAHPIFIERDRPPAFRQRAIIAGGRKLIRVEPRDTTLVPPEARSEYTEVTSISAGTYLYDLARDPGERTNLFTPGDPASESLLAQMAAHFTGGGTSAPAESVTVDEAMREKLRSLGYIR
jgi:arylsulfatase A-like enzyme